MLFVLRVMNDDTPLDLDELTSSVRELVGKRYSRRLIFDRALTHADIAEINGGESYECAYKFILRACSYPLPKRNMKKKTSPAFYPLTQGSYCSCADVGMMVVVFMSFLIAFAFIMTKKWMRRLR
jgi:hypothetical protein